MTRFAFLALCLSVGCGPPSQPPLLTVGAGNVIEAKSRRKSVADAAKSLSVSPLVVDGVTFDEDPVGFVRAVYWSERIDLFDAAIAEDRNARGVAIVFESARKRGQLHQDKPRLGDLLFLSDGEGSPTMVAVVVATGTSQFDIVGWFRDGPARVRLNADRSVPLGSTLRDASQTPIERRVLSFADPF